jgi:HEAT repeat protein
MDLAGSARLFLSNAVWRATGLRSAGRTLVHGLGSDDENQRTLAGMFLVQAGRQAEPLLEEALSKGENLPLVLTILGDIGDPKFEPELRRFSHDANPEVARAAADALLALARSRKQAG